MLVCVMTMRDPTSRLRQKDRYAGSEKPAGAEQLPGKWKLRTREVPFEGGGECPDIDFQFPRDVERPIRRLRTTVTRM
jgi:hypothetical protein